MGNSGQTGSGQHHRADPVSRTGWIGIVVEALPYTAKLTYSSINVQFARYPRYAKNSILGILPICLWKNFSKALISTKFAYFWTNT